MGSNGWGGWSSGSGGAGGGGGWSGGSGGSTKSKGLSGRKVTNPQDDLTSSLVRLAGSLNDAAKTGQDVNKLYQKIERQSQGLTPQQLARVHGALAGQGGYVGATLAPKYAKLVGAKTPSSALDYLNPVTAGSTVIGKVLDVASAPGQAVMSTIAEATREGGWQNVDPGKLGQAAWEGLLHKRHDTLSGIVEENTGYKLKGAARFATDFGGAVATDPLTYVSFGTSDLAKAGIQGASEVLGAERAAQLVKGGASILDAEEKARLAKSLSKPVYDALMKGARGGLKVSRPTIVERAVPFTRGRVTAPAIRMTEGRTIIPGPFAQAKAGKIIAATGAKLDDATRARLAAIATEGEATVRRAQELSDQAARLERAGQHADAEVLRRQATALDGQAQKYADEADRLQAEAEAAATQSVHPVAEGMPPVYHGSARPIEGGQLTPGSGSGADNAFGPGFYTTDTPDVARSYFRKGAQAGDEPVMYSARWQGSGAPKILDLEKPLPADALPHVRQWVHDSLSHVDMSQSTFDEILHAAEHGTGADFYKAVRKGLAEGGLSRGDATDVVDYLNSVVFHDRAGYDAFRYQGGVRTGNAEHNAYVWLQPDQVHIDEVARADNLPEVVQYREAASRANVSAADLRAQAAKAETSAAEAKRLRAEATALDEKAQNLLAQAEEVKAAHVRQAAEAGRSLGNGPIAKMAQRFADSKFATTTRGLFIPRGNIAHTYGEATARALDDARIRYRGEFNSSVEDDVNTLLHAARQTGVTNEELTNVIGPALDIGGDASRIPERLRPMYDALVKVRDRFTAAQVAAGVTHENALHITDEYFPRYLTQEAKKILTGKEGGVLVPAVPGEASVTRAPSGALRKRTANVDEPISEINPAFAAEHGGVQKFEENPLTAFSRRSVEAHQDVATSHYVDSVLKVRDSNGNRLVYTADELKAKGMKPPADWEEIRVPGSRIDPATGEKSSIGTIYAPKEIAAEVKKSYELLINDQSLRSFVDGLDKWMTLWKGYATVPLPFGLGFHERNAMGNVFLNWLAGIRPSDAAYAQAARIQHLMAKGAKEGDVYKFLDRAEAELVKRAREHDVVGEGFYGFDLPKNQKVAVQVPFRQATGKEHVRIPLTDKTVDVPVKAVRVGKAVNPLNTSNVLISSGRKFGSAIEENARLAHFIVMEHRFGNAAEAARSVRKYLFDYSDLTAAERHVFKRFMAFYTFTRKNLPVQVGALLRTPGKFSHLQAARVAAADTAEAPKGMYPSYLGELAGVPLPVGVSDTLAKVPGLGFKKGQQVAFAPDLPLLNATNSVSPAVQLLASLPGVDKVPGLPRNESGAGGAFKDLLTQTISGGAPGAVLTGTEALAAEKDFFSGRPLTGRVAAPAYALLPGLSQNRVLNGERQPTITAKTQFLAEGLLPTLGKVSSFAPQGAYEQEKAPRRRLSTFTGIRTYPLGPGTSRGEALRRNAEIQAILADLRAQGIQVASSRKKKKGGGW